MDEYLAVSGVDIDEEAFKLLRFRNNENLKQEGQSAYVDHETYETIAREIIRCKNDPVYFANRYFYIVSPGKGKHIIDTYEKQDELIQAMIDHDRVVTLASRQTGKCVSSSTKIKVRNKKTGEIEELTVEEFKLRLS